MSLQSYEKIRRCLERVADLRTRADAADNAASKAELRKHEAQWLDILETYQFLEDAGRHLITMRPNGSKAVEALPARSPRNGSSSLGLARPLLTFSRSLCTSRSNKLMAKRGRASTWPTKAEKNCIMSLECRMLTRVAEWVCHQRTFAGLRTGRRPAATGRHPRRERRAAMEAVAVACGRVSLSRLLVVPDRGFP